MLVVRHSKNKLTYIQFKLNTSSTHYITQPTRFQTTHGVVHLKGMQRGIFPSWWGLYPGPKQAGFHEPSQTPCLGHFTTSGNLQCSLLQENIQAISPCTPMG